MSRQHTIISIFTLVFFLIIYAVAISIRAHTYHDKVERLLTGATNIAKSQMESYMQNEEINRGQYDQSAVNMGIGVVWSYFQENRLSANITQFELVGYSNGRAAITDQVTYAIPGTLGLFHGNASVTLMKQ